MKTRAIITLGFLSINVALMAATNDVTGNWQGTLDMGAAKLRLVFKVSKTASGELTAKLDSLDQGARDIPADPVTVSNKTLRMEVKSVKGLYVGTLDATGTKATGLWSQGPAVLPLSLEKGGTNVIAEAEKLSSEELAANKQAAERMAGTWNGTLSTGTDDLRLRLNISKTPAGGATGTIDSMDQGANGIPISAIKLKGDKFRFEAKGVGGVYEGTLSTNGATIKGEWQQGGGELPLEFTKATSK
jgi:hypothetical protein